MVVSPQLTRRHKGEQRNRASEVEVYIGPAGGQGALFYASHVEFGTVLTPAQPYLRPAWESTKGEVLRLVTEGLKVEVDKASARAARKVARLARA
jgi:HK97 gp10 family phage protein